MKDESLLSASEGPVLCQAVGIRQKEKGLTLPSDSHLGTEHMQKVGQQDGIYLEADPLVHRLPKRVDVWGLGGGGGELREYRSRGRGGGRLCVCARVGPALWSERQTEALG